MKTHVDKLTLNFLFAFISFYTSYRYDYVLVTEISVRK